MTGRSELSSRGYLKCMLYRALALFVALTTPYLGARAEEMTGFVTIGMKRVFEEAKLRFESASDHSLEIQFASSPEIAERIQKGEAVDFIIVSRSALDGLIKSMIVPASNCFVVGRSSIAVAVPTGYPKPDISTPEGLKKALLAANRSHTRIQLQEARAEYSSRPCWSVSESRSK